MDQTLFQSLSDNFVLKEKAAVNGTFYKSQVLAVALS
jgi:hypothetical protein